MGPEELASPVKDRKFYLSVVNPFNRAMMPETSLHPEAGESEEFLTLQLAFLRKCK